jgi:hypothetical protein
MTVPELAAQLAAAPEPMIEQFFSADPILSKIGTDERAQSWRAGVIAQLQGSSEEKEPAAVVAPA